MSTDAIRSKEKNSGGETYNVELVPTPCLLCQQFYCVFFIVFPVVSSWYWFRNKKVLI